MYGLIANVISDHALRTGAKVHVTGIQGGRSAQVSGLSKCGRRIEKYVPWKRLMNIRPAFVPPALYNITSLWWEDKATPAKIAAQMNEMWGNVRVFHPDGRLIKNGISEGQAFRLRRNRYSDVRFSTVATIEPIHNRLRELTAAGTWYLAQVQKQKDANDPRTQTS